MSVQYEALVGHLFVVGGRALSSAPPGAAFQTAPKRVHRSREQDTLFVLVTPAGQTNANADFYEKLSKVAVESYFGSRLGVTGALRESAAALNQEVQKINQQQARDYRAGVLLLAKRADAVYLLRAGTTLCVAGLGGVYTTFPNDPDMLNILPLGSRSEPLVEFVHYTLSPNDLFILGDMSVAALSDAFLQETIQTGNIEMALDKLESGVERQALATVIQFVTENGSSTVPVGIQDIPVQEAATELPEFSPEATFLDEVTMPNQATVEISEPAIEAIEGGDGLAEVSEIAEDKVVAETEIVEVAAELSTEDAQALSSIEDSSKQSRRRGKSQKTSNTEKSQNIFQVILVALMLGLSNFLRALSQGLSALLDRILPEPEKGARQQLIPMNVVALVAVIIPAIVGVIVVGLSISNRDTTLFEELRMEALTAVEDAQEMEGNSLASPMDKRNAWIDARHWAELARKENPASTEMRQVVLDAQRFIDNYDKITRAEVFKLREFDENANLRGPILSPGNTDIYTLDRNRSLVYRDQLDGEGQRIIQSSDPVIARARAVNSYIVSNLIDIEWISESGAATPNTLIALDDNALLVSYHGTFGLSALALIKPPEWNRPEAIALWQDRLYVLDAGANQIWRYRRVDGFFQAAPEEYFTGSSRPSLGAAVDFGIDEDGAVYILFSDGTISKFVGGEPDFFELDNLPADGITDGRALFVSIDPRSYALFVADQDNGSIYQITLGGSVTTGYRPDDLLSRDFNRVTGVYLEPQRGNIFVLSGNALYRIRKTR